MKISSLIIENFRGIKTAEIKFPDHVVLIGDNNTGKSTILEAINLVLGPDRLRRRPPPIDEHDFYVGRYFYVPGPEESQAAPAVPAEALTGKVHVVFGRANRCSFYDLFCTL